MVIIDDGVDIDRLRNADHWHAVAGGRSFSRRSRSGSDWLDNPLKPYYVSASGRGTAVANLVLSAYPGSSLYFARVESDTGLKVLAEVGANFH